MSTQRPPGTRRRAWLSTLPAVLLLILVIFHGLGEKVHARLLQVGEGIWTGYAELRIDSPEPDCDPEALGARDEGESDDEDAFLDDLLGDEEEDEEAAAQAAAAAQQRCIAEHARYIDLGSRTTGGLRVFRGIETFIAAFVQFGVQNLRSLLVLLLLICGVTTTAMRHHIALRGARNKFEDRVSEGGQMLGNLMLLASSFFHWRVESDSGLDIQHSWLPVMWMIGFSIMAGFNVLHLVKPAGGESTGNKVRGLVTIPLYALMAFISGAYFFLLESHPSGLAIYLGKLTEHALLYIHVGLYVWAGMLLKRTTIASLTIGVVRPWKLPAELLAFVVVAASAIPTAYSGASGIFVIAAGAVIYRELRAGGARQQLALAATAMSGSLGVVLPPCLLVVIVASLNKQVTTDQLFSWGWKVFGLTSFLFLIASLISRKSKLTMEKPGVAARGSLEALKPLVPYTVIGILVLLVYGFGLGTTLNEHTAPMMLPVMLLMMLLYDRRKEAKNPPPTETGEKPQTLWGATFEATHETTGHIGALLLLMGSSICIGGVIERSQLMDILPSEFGSVWVTMLVLVAMLVLIGMIMDPYGAVILVSAAVADLAYRNGIDPVHFWMVVLVAFELGYLTPPVALNHLLARQVVGVSPDDEEVVEGGFWARHERILLPMSTMAVALVIVAFAPLLFS